MVYIQQLLYIQYQQRSTLVRLQYNDTFYELHFILKQHHITQHRQVQVFSILQQDRC